MKRSPSQSISLTRLLPSNSAWNDFFIPLIYLAGKGDLQQISVDLSTFNNIYTSKRYLMQDIVVTGVDK